MRYTTTPANPPMPQPPPEHKEPDSDAKGISDTSSVNAAQEIAWALNSATWKPPGASGQKAEKKDQGAPATANQFEGPAVDNTSSSSPRTSPPELFPNDGPNASRPPGQDPYEFPPSENKDYRSQVNQLPNTASIMRNVSHAGDRARNNRSYSSAEEFEQGSSGFRGLYSRESYARGQPTSNSDDNGPPSEPYPQAPTGAPNPGPTDNVAPLPLDPRLRDRDDRSLVYYDHPAEDGLQAPPPPGAAVPHPHGVTLALRDPVREPEAPAIVPTKRSSSSKSEPKTKRGPRMEVGPDGTTIRKNKVNQACEPCRKSKAKCDGVRPECATCLNKGRPCEFSSDPVRRRGPNKLPRSSNPKKRSGTSKGRRNANGEDSQQTSENQSHSPEPFPLPAGTTGMFPLPPPPGTIEIFGAPPRDGEPYIPLRPPQGTWEPRVVDAKYTFHPEVQPYPPLPPPPPAPVEEKQQSPAEERSNAQGAVSV